MDKQIVVYTFQSNTTNEQTIDIHNNLDKYPKIMVRGLRQTKKKRVGTVISFI